MLQIKDEFPVRAFPGKPKLNRKMRLAVDPKTSQSHLERIKTSKENNKLQNAPLPPELGEGDTHLQPCGTSSP